ncbi:CHAT domain-containing protein [Sorangium sp. KYC3313]|uniref:CHAT domain-containing protein n=1 Tax=Sorangium sp. KYC3313 TaxID=3449740 RepID=UPI003F889395
MNPILQSLVGDPPVLVAFRSDPVGTTLRLRAEYTAIDPWLAHVLRAQATQGAQIDAQSRETERRVNLQLGALGIASGPSAPAAPTTDPAVLLLADVLAALVSYRGDPPSGPNLRAKAQDILRGTLGAQDAQRLASAECHPMLLREMAAPFLGALVGITSPATKLAAALALPRELLASMGLQPQPSTQSAHAPRCFGPDGAFTIRTDWPWCATEMSDGRTRGVVLWHREARFSGGPMAMVQQVAPGTPCSPSMLQVFLFPLASGDPRKLNAMYDGLSSSMGGSLASFGMSNVLYQDAVMVRLRGRDVPVVRMRRGVNVPLWGRLDMVEQRYLMVDPQRGVGAVIGWHCPFSDAGSWEAAVRDVAGTFRFGDRFPTPIVADVPTCGRPAVDAQLQACWVMDFGQGDLSGAAAAANDGDDRVAALVARAVVLAARGRYRRALDLLEVAYRDVEPAYARLVAMLGVRVASHADGLRPDNTVVLVPELKAALQTWGERHARHQRGPCPLSEFVAITAGVNAAIDLVNDVATNETNHRRAEALIGWTLEETLAEGVLAARAVNLRPAVHLGVTSLLLNLTPETLDGRRAELSRLVAEADRARDPLLATWLRVTDVDTSLRGNDRANAMARATGLPIPDFVLAGANSEEQLTMAAEAYRLAVESYLAIGAPRGALRARWRRAMLLGRATASGEDLARAVEKLEAIQKEAIEHKDNRLAMDAALAEIVVRWRRGDASSVLEEKLSPHTKAAAREGARGWLCAWGAILREVARALWIDQGELDAFLRATKLALWLYDAAEEPWGSYQVTNERLSALAAIGAAAEVLEEVDRAMTRVREACRANPGDLVGWMRFYSLGTQAMQAYTQEGDAARLERVAAELEEALTALPAPKEGSPDPSGAGFGSAADPAAMGEQLAAMMSQLVPASLAQLRLAAAFHASFARARAVVDVRGHPAAREEIEVARRAAIASGNPVFEATIHALARDRAATLAAVGRVLDGKATLTRGPLEALFLKMAEGTPGVDAQAAREARIADTARAMVTLLVRVEAWDEAMRILDRLSAEPLLRRLPDVGDINHTLDRAIVFMGTGRVDSGLAAFAAAAKGYEARRGALRSERFRRTLGAARYAQAIYGGWACALAQTGDWAGAFEKADLVRGRLLSEALAGRAQAAEGSIPARKARAQVERLTTQLASLRHRPEVAPARVAQLEAELDRALDELAKNDGAAAGRESAVPPGALRLEPGTLLIAYLLHARELLAWAVDASGIVATHRTTSDGEAPLDATAFGARVLAASQSVGAGTMAAPAVDALASILVAPFADAIERAERVVIVPNAQLAGFPFGVLPVRGEPLGIQRPLTIVPAASLLGRPEPEASRSAASAHEVLIVGNPAKMRHRDVLGRDHDLATLDGARNEARLVASLYGAEPLIGEAASAQAVRARLIKATRVVHLATHGVLEPAAPLASAIALADGEELTAADWLGMDLDADIVVLSACDTGRGAVQGGEVVGLARAILLAGARAVVVSLWPVADRATALVMRRFHEELRAGAMAEEALRRASAWLRALDSADAAREIEDADLSRDVAARHRPAAGADRPYGNAHFWAPFIVIRASAS